MLGPTARPGARPVVDAPSVRAVNLSRILAAVLAADTPPTRADVALATTTARATAARLVDELVGAGLLEELARPEGAPRRPGRPGTPLGPGRRVGALGLQVDIGGLTAVVVDLRGTVLAHEVVEDDLRDSDPEPVLRDLGRLTTRAVQQVGAEVRLVGAGLALPGIVTGDGTLLRAPNLGWTTVPVARLLSGTGGLERLSVGNEADLAAVTVSYTAPGRPSGLRDFVYLSGSTGIGGAIVVDGHPLRGRHGWAGEIGHVTVDPSGPACPCGSTGCLEQFAGSRALAAAAGLDPGTDPARVADLARADDPAARAAVERATRALGIALAGVVNVVDVPVVVLGGHLREIGDLVRPDLQRTLHDRVLAADWDEPGVRVAEGGSTAAATGAAWSELHRLVADPAAWIDRG